ncbi:MAG: dethiobiotin synthase [Leptospirales bacterium]|jgi:dethiobiotin synthetase
MSVFVCGTDTGVGKTITSAALMRSYRDVPGLRYWKPVQTGGDDDRGTVQSLAGLASDRLHPNTYRFNEPLSPHRAAELEDDQIVMDRLLEDLTRYRAAGPLIVEGAGGLLVPLNRRTTWLDFLRLAQLPVVIVARTSLGTINHSLMTARILKAAELPVVGFVFCGPDNPDNVRTIMEFTDLPALTQFEYTDGEALTANVDPAGLLLRLWSKA